MAIRIGLLGFGRTGSVVAKEIVQDPDLQLEWVCRRTIPSELTYASHSLGFDESFAPFITFSNLSSDFLKKHPVDIVIDFSNSAVSKYYHIFSESKIRIVSAISRYSDKDLNLVRDAGNVTPVLYSPNITLGINWLMIASKVLKEIIPQADIEVVEEHFREKKEVSGTALKLAGHLELEPAKHVNSIRVGGVVGKHEVIFGLPNQTIRLTHESINRAAFGTGAAYAAKWLSDKPVGLYSMEQVFHEKFVRKIKDLEF